MLRKFLLLAAAGALLPATVSQAGFDEGDWDLALFGQGVAHSADFDGVGGSLGLKLGYFVSEPVEVGVRQLFAYEDWTGSSLNGDTSIFAEYHFTLGDKGEWVPFAGARLGYIWGGGVNNTWYAAPTVGLKYFVNSTTYIYASVEYDFFFDTPSGSDDGQFYYGVGLGVRL